MNQSTDHLQRRIQTLASALVLFEQAAPGSIEQDVFRNALAKSYERVQETSFNLLKQALRAFGHRPNKLDATSVKGLLRLSSTHGLMTPVQVERWFAYRDNCDNVAHDDDEDVARQTLELLPSFVADVTHLEASLRQRLRQ